MEGNDTVYNFDKGSLLPAYVLDPGSDGKVYGKALAAEDYLGKSSFGLLLETDDHIFIEQSETTHIEKGPLNISSPKDSRRLVIVDKARQTVHSIYIIDDLFNGLLSETLNKNTTLVGNNRSIMWYGTEGKVIVTVNALELLGKTGKNQTSKFLPKELMDLNEESNPVLFVFTMKKFDLNDRNSL